jgi:hypothetical protein
MFLVLVYHQSGECMTHNAFDEYIKTIFNKFPSIYFEKLDTSKMITYKESKCFEYSDSIITNKDRNYYLDGYFQNKNYITNESDVVSLFQNDELCDKIMVKYPSLEDSYFIHIRRGDFLKCNIYDFDKDSYYEKALNYISEKDEYAHFFILSDDIEYAKVYPLFNNISKTIVNDLCTLESLYLMSLCKKGGICANSTFSGWASKLNTNSDKIVIVPKNWINISYDYEIPFNYTVSF